MPAPAMSIWRRVMRDSCNIAGDYRYIDVIMPVLRHLAAAVVLGIALCAQGATTAPTVKAEDLPRIAPTEARDAINTFKVRPGFHIELAAAEPNVTSPVAMCFDEKGGCS